MTEITIESILEEWREDSLINESALVRELVKTTSLHSKYIGYFIFFKQKLSLAESKMNKMAWKKRKYFRGECDRDDLVKYGWSQWSGLKPGSTELSQLLEFDSDMCDYRRVVADLKMAVQCLEYIIKQINQRDFTLKAVVEYQKFLSGN
jgi:hypothetical protein